MKKNLGKYDLEFFWVCMKIGLGVLIYRGCLELLSTFIVAPAATFSVFINDMSLIYTITYCLTGVVSVLSFLVAAVVLWIALRIGKRKNYQPTMWGWRVTPVAPFLIIATVAINFAMAEINSLIVSILSADPMLDMSNQFGQGVTLLQIIVMIISTAIIPGIVEEIMFRGIILTNLMPYGRGTAIVCSALLFGLMHMNPAQFFYTTLMGLILGYIYVRTRSIWLCIVIHFTNNALAVVQEIFYHRYEMGTAVVMSSWLTLIVAILGIISIGVLMIVRRYDRKRSVTEMGSFGRICAPSMSYEARPVGGNKKIFMFFCSTVGVFTVWVFSSMMMTAFLYLVMGQIG